MIVEQDETLIIEQTQDFKRKKFSIASSPEAFRILSKGIYSDPIKAVIRELSTNAYDGHIVAGNTDVPFDVHLPTRLDPVFRVRDYGSSLTPQQIEDIYTTYFESSKRSDNEQTGSLGLGSKTPFAIVSSFIVTTFLDGVKRIYSAIISEDGCPDIVEMATMETDEPNGVEVKLTVPPSDCYNFETRARDVFAFFNTTPNVYSGNNKIEISKPKYASKTNDFGVITNAWLGSTSNYAIMANVAYVIDLQPLEGKISKERLSILSDLYATYHFFFENGEVNFTASREHLEYTPRTIAAIERRIDKIMEMVQEEFDELRNRGTTLVEACGIINKLVMTGNGSSINKTALRALATQNMQQNQHIMWKNTQITSSMLNSLQVSVIQTFSRNEVNIIGDVITAKSSLVTAPVMFTASSGAKLKLTVETSPITKERGQYKRTVVYRIPTGNTAFIVNDGKVAQYKIVNHILDTKYTAERILVFSVDQADLLTSFKKACGIQSYEKTSKLSVANIERQTLVKSCRVFSASGQISDKPVDNIKDISYYVVAKGSVYTFEMFDTIFEYSNAQEVIKELTRNNILKAHEEVLIIPASSTEKLLNLYPNLKPIATAIKGVTWSTLQKYTQVVLLRNYVKTKSDNLYFLNNVNQVEDAVNRVASFDVSLTAFINRFKGVNSRAKSMLQELTSHTYRYVETNPRLATVLNNHLIKDKEFKQAVLNLNDFILAEKEVRTVLPITQMQQAANIDTMALTRYVEADWNANKQLIEKELNNV